VCRVRIKPDGSVGWNPGKKNPKILRPTAAADPAVPIVVVADDKGKPFTKIK